MNPVLSVVVPVYNEGESIVGCLDAVLASIDVPCEVLVVYDFPEDTTVGPLTRYAADHPEVLPTHNAYGRGPANAIRFGLDAATAPVAVVTMSDGSDDYSQIEDLARLVGDDSGVAIAAASRYMKGGRQVGGPFVKSTLSRIAGLSLHYLGRVGTRDATNSFKAYSTEFIRLVGVESKAGFEIGIELVAKARRLRRRVVEIPTTWRDRTEGESNFRTAAWIPKYLKWYLFAFGPRLSEMQLASRRQGAKQK